MTNPRIAPPGEPGAQPSENEGEVRDEKARARARVGTVIKKKWRLDALLGVGGMASVFAATHRNGSRAALKIMHTEFARDSNIRERFLREGYVANRIDHAGRVAILDDDITDQEEPFLIMELLEGETAQQLWRRKERRVPVEEALWIAAEVLGTLESFHVQGIIHRDLKPANIFITKENVVKLLDFGVARMRGAPGEVTRAGTALGTPSFMAPEQARGVADEVDGRADVFSVGATLYALLSGQRLHQARSDSESFILAATQPAPSLARIAPQIPIEVIRLVDRALAWAPRNRFQSAAAMRKEVQRLLDALRSGAISRNPSTSSMRRVVEEPGAAPTIEEHGAPTELAMPDDPAVLRLANIWRRIGTLLPLAGRFGWTHPQVDAALREAFGAIVEALREGPDLVSWRIRPYALFHRGQIVWEPEAPLDALPYHLFAAGVRGVRLLPGLTEEELRELVSVMMIEPSRDLSPEDDIASVLWEMKLEHVATDILDDFAEGDAADMETFYEETDDVESIARESGQARADQVEAAAMPIETDMAALHAARKAASVLALDPVAKRALGAQLAIGPEKWRERFADVIADALVQSNRQGDVHLITTTLAGSAQDLVRARLFGVFFSTVEAFFKAIEAAAPREEAPEIRAALARGILTPDTLKLLVWEALGGPVTSGAHPGPFGVDSGEASGQSKVSSGPMSRATSGVRSSEAASGPAVRPWDAKNASSASSAKNARQSASAIEAAHGDSSAVSSMPTPGGGGSGATPSAPFGRSISGAMAPGSLGARSLLLSSGSTPPVDLNAIARGLVPILAELGPAHMDAVIDVLGATSHEGLRRVFLAYLERTIPGNEERAVARLATVDLDVARPLLRSLAGAKTEAAFTALRRLAVSPDPSLRCEAAACLAGSPEELRDELGQLAEGAEPEVRLAALRAIVGHEVAGAVPRLVRRAQDSGFHRLSADERREILSALYSLDPERAEPVVVDIVMKHGLLVDDTIEETRALAADLLGQRGRSQEALSAVLSATKRRWWNTQTLREAATKAAEAIAARLGKQITASGEVQ